MIGHDMRDATVDAWGSGAYLRLVLGLEGVRNGSVSDGLPGGLTGGTKLDSSQATCSARRQVLSDFVPLASVQGGGGTDGGGSSWQTSRATPFIGPMALVAIGLGAAALAVSLRAPREFRAPGPTVPVSTTTTTEPSQMGGLMSPPTFPTTTSTTDPSYIGGLKSTPTFPANDPSPASASGSSDDDFDPPTGD